MQIAAKTRAGFNRDAPEAQKCRKKMKNDDFDDDDDDFQDFEDFEDFQDCRHPARKKNGNHLEWGRYVPAHAVVTDVHDPSHSGPDKWAI